jgi:hypothetical protein
MARHEKIFKREDGTQYRIDAFLYVESFSQLRFKYDVSVTWKAKGKRKWLNVSDSDDWECRKLDIEDREKWHYQKYLEHVTAEEILETKLELWNKIKPE